MSRSALCLSMKEKSSVQMRIKYIHLMCSGAMVWTRLGRLVYGVSDIDLCSILGSAGSECSRLVFENSPYSPEVTPGVMREESIKVLRKYFTDHTKG